MQIDTALSSHLPVKREEALAYWNRHPFYAPDTVVLGIDIGIEGIGIAVRKGTELLYCKTLLVDLPEANALAKRRTYRAARHARKNRRTRMRRLKALFEKHGLPWVDDEIISRSDPFKLRYRAITGKLASREALSICIRSCVLRRGYDYFAMDAHSVGEYPWGAELKMKDAKKWLQSAYVDAEMRKYLIAISDSLTEIEAKQEEWKQLVEERHKKAAFEGIDAMLAAYAGKTLNERKARGFNYPRAHVQAHLQNIINRHSDLIDDAEAFSAALFLPNDTKTNKQKSIFLYNRKTPDEAKKVYERKVKKCPYCEWLGLPTKRCCTAEHIAYRRWALVDFLSVRKFELSTNKLPIGKVKLPEQAVEALFTAMETGIATWKDAKKLMEAALKKQNYALTPKSEWNKAQFKQLKDIVAPTMIARKGRAAISETAAQTMYEAATQNGTCFSPNAMEEWKKESGLYTFRKNLLSESGIYPQVEALLGQRQWKVLKTTGILQRIFTKDLKQLLGGKTRPDYCVVETIKNAAANKDAAQKTAKEQKANRERREKQAAAYGRENASHADFLRMRLFEEQGGSPQLSARCPFTGQELKLADLFSGEIELAHIYPDARGGLYMAENLVLTTRKTNAAMGNRTPMEAAHAGLPDWPSWDNILERVKTFHWSEEKKQHFASSFDVFPNFNNLTRTAQLARELRHCLIIWLGINGNEEEIRRRIGNPCGVYTAAARRSWLGPEYKKDRSDNLHHRKDAAVMSCLPPEGLNDIRNKGIFEAEKTAKGNRQLMCIQGLPLPDFNKVWNDGSVCPIEKKESRSKYKSLGDSTFWSVDKNGITHQRTPLSPNIKFAVLRDTLNNMGIPAKDIPTEKAITQWSINCQAATKEESALPMPELKLLNGTPIRSIWKFGSKGNLDKSPIGWNGLITESGKFHQLRSLDASNDRLELWLGWDAKKKCWKYYKRIIPTRAAMAGLKRLGLPWRGAKNAPPYLLNLLAENNARDLREMLCGILPPHAIKVATFRKGDTFSLSFERDDKYIEDLQKKGHVNMSDHPKNLENWGKISAIKSDTSLTFKSLTHKDRKIRTLQSVQEYAKLLQLDTPDAEATKRKLTPPV